MVTPFFMNKLLALISLEGKKVFQKKFPFKYLCSLNKRYLCPKYHYYEIH